MFSVSSQTYGENNIDTFILTIYRISLDCLCVFKY